MRRTQDQPTGTEASSSVRLALMAFMACFLIPANFDIAALHMSFARTYIVVAFFPCLFLFFKSRDITFNAADALVVGLMLWVNVVILYHVGLSRIQYMGLTITDMGGAYLLGRVLLSKPGSITQFWRYFAFAMLIMFPFGVIELITNKLVLNELFQPILSVYKDVHPGTRLGFDRVQGNFEHPIVYGMFWATGLASILVTFQAKFWRTVVGAVCIATAGLSLSSAAFLVVIIQVALLAWGKITGGRWKLLLASSAAMYLVLEVLSNRAAIVAISTRLAFNSWTAYYRSLIWEYGSRNVWNNPIFGLGPNVDWVHPAWMKASVDNYWLLVAMKYGLPGIALLLAILIVIVTKLVRAKQLPEAIRTYRIPYLVSMFALFVGLGTVAAWRELLNFLFFLMAIGVNMATIRATEPVAADAPTSVPRRASRYTRQEQFYLPRDRKTATARFG